MNRMWWSLREKYGTPDWSSTIPNQTKPNRVGQRVVRYDDVKPNIWVRLRLGFWWVRLVLKVGLEKRTGSEFGLCGGLLSVSSNINNVGWAQVTNREITLLRTLLPIIFRVFLSHIFIGLTYFIF